jgi:hypothetical protein
LVGAARGGKQQRRPRIDEHDASPLAGVIADLIQSRDGPTIDARRADLVPGNLFPQFGSSWGSLSFLHSLPSPQNDHHGGD